MGGIGSWLKSLKAVCYLFTSTREPPSRGPATVGLLDRTSIEAVRNEIARALIDSKIPSLSTFPTS